MGGLGWSPVAVAVGWGVRRVVKCWVRPVGSRFGPRRMIRSRGRWAFCAAEMAVARYEGCVTRPLAPESRSWKASSSAV
jgi:hypothetical protein